MDELFCLGEDVRILKEENSLLKRTLLYYANIENYGPLNGERSVSSVGFDKGSKARKALELVEKNEGRKEGV